ncbi:CAP domain-containing protein [Melanogaster broomeanus]|nr:CAP domain-containing protein [Melanogaster broomeanus]
MRAFLLVTALLSVCPGVVLAMTPNQTVTPETVYLYAHNVVRSTFKAQPLTWSTDLATKAQDWASACNFKHTDGQLGPYGENISAGTGNFTIVRAMEMFMEGLVTFDPNNPTFSDFTQIVWQSTTQLGCASAQCNGIFDADFGNATMHVCLYEPVGNVVGELL